MRLAISRAFTKAMLDVHSVLGIVFGAALYLVCFSGTLAVIAGSFEHWEQPGAPTLTAASPDALTRAAREGYARAAALGKVDFLYVSAPTDLTPRLAVYASAEGEEEAHQWSADAAGRLVPAPEAAWTDFMRGQHHDFNLPDPWGLYLVGLLGTLLIALLVSGLLAHRQIIREAFHLRRGGTRRRINVDLHNRTGIWALPFHVIIALTGALLGLAGLIIGVLALVAYQGDQDRAIAALTGPAPTHDLRPAPIPDIAPMARLVAAHAPDAPITSVVFLQPGTRGQLVSLTTADTHHLSRNEGWTFTPGGRLLAKAGFTDGTLGMRIYGMITPLHYGTYGGLPLQLVYLLLGATLTVTVATGLSIWLARRREQGRAAPVWERLWQGAIWSQPIAFALSAFGALAFSGSPTVIYWLAAVAALAASALLPAGRRTNRVWAGASAAALFAVAIVHIVVRGVPDAPAATIDGALAAVAVALVWRMRGGVENPVGSAINK